MTFNLNIPGSQLIALERKLKAWENDRKKRLAAAVFATGLQVRNEAIQRFVTKDEGDVKDDRGRLRPHVREGFLRASIQPPRLEGLKAYVEAGGSLARYAPYVEYGTKTARPHPFMFPAAESQRAAHRDRIVKALRGRLLG